MILQVCSWPLWAEKKIPARSKLKFSKEADPRTLILPQHVLAPCANICNLLRVCFWGAEWVADITRTYTFCIFLLRAYYQQSKRKHEARSCKAQLAKQKSVSKVVPRMIVATPLCPLFAWLPLPHPANTWGGGSATTSPCSTGAVGAKKSAVEHGWLT